MREIFNAGNESYYLIFAQEGGPGNMIYLSIAHDGHISYILPARCMLRQLHVHSFF